MMCAWSGRGWVGVEAVGRRRVRLVGHPGLRRWWKWWWSGTVGRGRRSRESVFDVDNGFVTEATESQIVIALIW